MKKLIFFALLLFGTTMVVTAEHKTDSNVVRTEQTAALATATHSGLV